MNSFNNPKLKNLNNSISSLKNKWLSSSGFNKNKVSELSFATHGDLNTKDVLELEEITKEFLGGKIVANDNINLKIRRNEIHAIVGENGSGKSTLMSILFGIYKPTKGRIKINGKELDITTPQIAKAIGIGMVHQHYQLIENMSLIENVILGQEGSFNLSLKNMEKKFDELCKKYNFNLDPKSLVEDLNIGQKQKLEIIKVLWEEKEILIFDEPTAALSKDEIDEFLSIIKNFKNEGKTVLFISHKLKEVREIADRLSVLRKGKVIKTLDAKKLKIEQISKLMVGEIIKLKFNKKHKIQDKVAIEVKNLTTAKEDGAQKLENINFKVKVGEILGIAGIGDNGQTEILEAITGLRNVLSGKIILDEKIDITQYSIRNKQNYMLHIPENRHKYGIASNMNLINNSVITNINSKEFSKFWIQPGERSGTNIIKDISKIKKWTRKIVDEMNVEGASDISNSIGNLSGGNQQKFVVGREVLQDGFKVLVAGHPTRGLDIKAIKNIYESIIEKSKDMGIILSSYELEELLSVCDKIIVVYNGKIVKTIDAKKASAQFEIAKAMTGAGK